MEMGFFVFELIFVASNSNLVLVDGFLLGFLCFLETVLFVQQ